MSISNGDQYRNTTSLILKMNPPRERRLIFNLRELEAHNERVAGMRNKSTALRARVGASRYLRIEPMFRLFP
jgi:hypothetical protein